MKTFRKTEQVRYYKLDGDRLTITTDPTFSALSPDKLVVGKIQFIRD